MHHSSHSSHRLRRGLISALLGALLSASVVLIAPSANASSALLCVGFSDCANKGYSDSSYSKYWGNMYWLMYSGRNCVNYVAFREVQAGMANKRPWDGSGNAEAWGRFNPSITDKTPRVGSVAWWGSYAPGAGRLGHVAYVEKVISPTEIVVSESNWGNDFDWRHITTAANWPTGFIHWTDRTLVPATVPSVPGDPAVNDVIAVDPGAWPDGTTFSYQWGIRWVPIPGATGQKYRPQADQLGQKLTVQVTATRPGYSPATLTVGPRLAIAPGTMEGLTSPAISGTVQVGHALSVSMPQVAPNGFMAVQWYADNTPIPGATTETFTPTQDQNGAVLTAAVTATRESFTPLTTYSARTIPVVSPPIVLNAAGGISGQHLTNAPMAASPGAYDPADAAVKYQWLRNGTPISGATDRTYVPTAADLAQKMGVTVSITKDKYLDAVRTYTDSTPIKSTSSVVAVAVPGSNGAKFHVRVNAYGTTPTGTVVATITGRHYLGTLVDGLAVFYGVNIPTGDQSFTVSYAGDAKTTGSSGGGTVRILGSSTTHTVIDRQGVVTGGPLAVGGTLVAPKVAYAPYDATISYQWRRDGAPIAGATGTTYKITHADSGHMVTVVETASRAGLMPSTAVFGPSGPVIGEPTITVETLGGMTQAKATARVIGSDGQPASGSVTFTAAGQTATSDLWNGVATATINNLPAGTQTVTATYTGDLDTISGKASATVPVLAQAAWHTAAVQKDVPVTGVPKVGNTLKVDVRAYAPWSGQLMYRWVRDNTTIPGATGATYKVTAADLGHTLRARAMVFAQNTTPTDAFYVVPGGTIKTTPEVTWTINNGYSGITFTVKVTAAGMPSTGKVQLVLRDPMRSVLVDLVNGVAVLKMPDVPKGTRAFYIAYSGDAAADRDRKSVYVNH